MLSQLSYSPLEVEVIRKVNTSELPVARRSQPKLQTAALGAEPMSGSLRNNSTIARSRSVRLTLTRLSAFYVNKQRSP